jgi:class 3 adenylate cyclase
MSLPGGTVTFLFTDIEGSTRLREVQRERIQAARLFGAAEARFAALGTHLEAPDRPEYEQDLAAARA